MKFLHFSYESNGALVFGLGFTSVASGGRWNQAQGTWMGSREGPSAGCFFTCSGRFGRKEKNFPRNAFSDPDALGHFEFKRRIF